MNKKLNWGILSTGAIAQALARAIPLSRTGNLAAVASRQKAAADRFADEYKVRTRYGSYDELLADRQIDAVYIATPHPQHARWAIKAAEAKKHILCEKPLGVNHAEAMAMIEAADVNGVFLMEAFMYRCHPQTHKLVELIRNRAIGEVRVIQATFSFNAGFNANSRIYNNDAAGGGILDVGCYPVSMSRLIAGAAMGKDFADPIEVKATGHLGQTGVDEWSVASLRFAGDVVAQLSTGVAVNQENVVRIYGGEGMILLENPWVANRRDADAGKIILNPHDSRKREEITAASAGTSFQIEIDVAGDAIISGAKQAPSPAMSWPDSLGQARTLDRWRESIGLVYDFETAKKFPKTTVAGRGLRKRDSTKMKYGRITGLDKPVSRLVMGVDNQETLPHAAVMFDDFFERGGNAFDTAWVYGRNGAMERTLGNWMKVRGVRDECVVIVKGAHTPLCTPKHLSEQLEQSLERLQIDHADIYLMHRDNVDVPAGEFVDVLNEHQRAGRIRAFGGSNWTLPRVEEANAHARKGGLSPFSVVSNNFSLARMVEPIWPGCVSASDPASRAWLTKNQMPLLAWSSQARGFFLPGRAHPDKRDDEELVRTWYSEDNFDRLKRANELAKKKGVEPIQIALAYVLHQPFPTFALIGPRVLSETRSSVAASGVIISEAESNWLSLTAKSA